MPDLDDLVLVRRGDLRELWRAALEDPPARISVVSRLLAAVNGEAATVEEQWRIVGTDGDEDTANSLEDGLEWAADFDQRYPESAPHHVERRTIVVGPWTTQETP